MNDNTEPDPWTDERIRDAFIDDGGQSEYDDPIHGAQTQRRVAGAIFDRWLAARDAKIRDEREPVVVDDAMRSRIGALVEQAQGDLVRIEGEWGMGLGFDDLVARGDDDALLIQAVRADLAALNPGAQETDR